RSGRRRCKRRCASRSGNASTFRSTSSSRAAASWCTSRTASSVEAVVLAGGLGTRLRAAVSDVPKPMAPVGGRPFLERLLDYWIGQGVRRAVLAVGYLHDMIRGHFGDEYRGCAIAYSIEEQPLGTGGALVQSLPLVHGERFLVL